MNDTQPKSNLKSFWERPEGTTGMITLAGIAIGLYFALPLLLTFVTGLFALLGYTIGVVVLTAVLAALLVILTDKRTRILFSLAFKMAMKKLTSAIINMDPIAVMELYVDRMTEKRAKVREARDKLKGQKRKLEDQLRSSEGEYKNAMGIAEQARMSGNATQLQLQARKSARLEELARDTLMPLLSQISAHVDAADKVYEATGFIIDDMTDDIRVRKIRQENVKASFSLMSASKEILEGGSAERLMYDEAAEADLNSYYQKLGAVDAFLEDSKPVLDGFDLQNGVYEQQALARIEQWRSGQSFDFNSNVLSQRKAEPVLLSRK